MDVNSVVLIGRLTRDAERRATGGGVAVVNFGLAVNRHQKVGDQWKDVGHFFDVAAFGKVAESCHQYLVKGKQVCIQGELQQDRWEKDGQQHSRVKIVAHSIQLLGGGKPREDQPEWKCDPCEKDGPKQDTFSDDIPF